MNGVESKHAEDQRLILCGITALKKHKCQFVCVFYSFGEGKHL